MSSDSFVKNRTRLRPVYKLVNGWDGDKPHFDAAFHCPKCSKRLGSAIVEPSRNESFETAVWKSICDDDGGFEMHCADCNLWWFSETVVTYDYRVADEFDSKPHYRYSHHDPPVAGKIDKWSAPVVDDFYHRCSGTIPTEADTFLEKFNFTFQPRCAMCKVFKETDELDFHHWDYDEDIGVSLCRSCHNYIHDGLTAGEQSDQSWTDTWKHPAVARAVKKYREENVTNVPAGRLSYQDIKLRLNIPWTVNAISNTMQEWADRRCNHTITLPPWCEDCKMTVSASRPKQRLSKTDEIEEAKAIVDPNYD